MASDIFSKIATLLNRIADVVSQGSLERIRLIKQFNFFFKEAYFTSEIDKLCSVTTSAGNPANRHELSAFFLRSGFKITIENDRGLDKNDYIEISMYVLDNAHFVRQLMALGYDTLIIRGKTTFLELQIPLKDIANLQKFMLNQ